MQQQPEVSSTKKRIVRVPLKATGSTLPGTISNLITVSVVQVLFQWMNLISKI
jgi:hypothetical protein